MFSFGFNASGEKTFPYAVGNPTYLDNTDALSALLIAGYNKHIVMFIYPF